MRTDDTLALLEKRGEKGVSSEEFGKKFGFQNPGSISKTIGILRDAGHDIPYDKERGVFVLKKKAVAFLKIRKATASLKKTPQSSPEKVNPSQKKN